MPLLRAGGVRALALVPAVRGVVRVSMPLLRAGGVRAASAPISATSVSLSQCPCCGRGECGLHAGGVRGCGRTAGLNALVAGGGSAGAFTFALFAGCGGGSSQCPCCGRGQCGFRSGATAPASRASSAVSMPLLRAGGVRGDAEVCNFCGTSRLNALVAGRGSAGRDRERPAELHVRLVSMPLLRAGGVRAKYGNGKACRQACMSQCPCCGRGECGSGIACFRVTPKEVSMPLLRAGGVRAFRYGGPGAGGRDVSQCPCCGRGGVRVP